ncbi:phage virion morphogenesis protein [Desulfovibrio sulfodismutans]|uniref:Phage virion morphogenesis protein n=1 Tax=Desulfolutivibrio sulfodismutans TaxID=63561 RepID=A0A7K3NMI0_9BACT|nr:phage virion morphogenesis protein [Desulfolutivibrio sulfodismutans]NDY57401.1 phage virion morphogenesis protein [Desulfolutivibrio sulfodismutans]QLA11883.1 phage virion morphogenesis protein [Desulfolutivibrio sulfodismutans DSM 3696]QLA13542.1 phage virion morphogenesis protein [Desulfolutivibrio sulfodismutans DSM 3696]
MDGFTVRVEDAQVQELLHKLGRQAGGTRDIMDAMGTALLSQIQEGYQREQSPDGRAWKKLAPATIRSRRRAGHWPGPMLRVSGELFRSITYQAGDGRLEIGSNKPYAAIHQFGGQVSRPERRGVLRFKVNMETGKSRFAKQSKANFEQDVTFRAGAVTIPARPYLFTASGTLPDPWIAAVLGILRTYLEVAP